MSAKIIPFRIIVNPIPHSDLTSRVNHNADMDYDTVAAREIAALAREKNWTDCFHASGKLNARALAEKLDKEAKSRGATKTIHQSTIHRIQKGEITGKPETLAPIALGFGMRVTDLYARIHPETASAPAAPELPTEAVELWEDFAHLPKPMQEFYRQSIRASREQAERYPHVAALANPEAIRAAAEVKTQRLRAKRTNK